MAAEGLTTIRSSGGPRETVNRLEAAVKAKGMTVFAHIDHAAGAAARRSCRLVLHPLRGPAADEMR